MKLVIGLGNPGNNYENTRHNMGWMAIDQFAKDNNGYSHDYCRDSSCVVCAILCI